MFSDLFKRAQDTVDNAVAQAVNRLIMVVPFMVAAGFGTAALSDYLATRFDPTTSNLVIAGGYAAVGLLLVAVMGGTSRPAIAPVEPPQAEAARDTDANTDCAAKSAFAGMAPQDRDLLAAAVSSVAPMALPSLLRMGLRNLPLIVAIAAAVYIFSQSAAGNNSEGHGTAEDAEQTG